jgi:hypothetical protein
MAAPANGRVAKFTALFPTKADRNKRMDVTQFLYATFLTVAFSALIIWASVTLYRYVRSQFRPGEEIVVGNFTAIGEGLPTDKAAVGTALASKLERLRRVAARGPSGFGLIQTPTLTSVPDQVSERQGDVRQRLENLNLKVKDVDVNAVMDALRSMFSPARPALEGQLNDVGDRLEIRAALLWKGNTVGGWVASRRKPGAEQKGSIEIQDTLNDLYDDLLFQIIFDIPRNPKLHWWAQSRGDDAIPNWQTLEAMTLGLEALQSYESSLEYGDLERAIRHLDRIPVYAPGYALGHYFLAIALGEDRQEKRAASVLFEVLRTPAPKSIYWSACFQRAAALLRMYGKDPAEEAANVVLAPLIAELETASGQKSPSKNGEKEFATMLLPMAYAQLAYTYGTLFTLGSTIDKAKLRANSLEASDHAFTTFQQAGKVWPSDQQRLEVERWIYNTRGYSQFRIAQYERREAMKAQPADQVQLDADFKKKCELALTDLRKANELLPNNYEVLQNEAMILDDRDYDPTGAYLVEAESLYERTTVFVPRDYYQYERLALICWRQLRQIPPRSIQTVLLDKGKKDTAMTVERRYPEKSRTATMLASYFTAWEAQLESDPAKKQSKLKDAVDQARMAVPLGPPPDPAHDTADLIQKLAEGLTGTDKPTTDLKTDASAVAKELSAIKP